MEDLQNVYCENLAVTTGGASTNILDGVAPGDAIGSEMVAVLKITETFTGTTSVKFDLQTDDNSAFSSAATLLTFGDFPIAQLTLGTVKQIKIPLGAERYTRFFTTVTGASATAGKYTAYLAPNYTRDFPAAKL